MPVYETNHIYKLVHRKEYPFDIELRSNDEIILDEFKYFINRYTGHYDLYFDEDKQIYAFPLMDAYNDINQAADIDELREILRNNKYKITEEDVILIDPADDESSEDSDGAYDDIAEEIKSDNDGGFAVEEEPW